MEAAKREEAPRMTGLRRRASGKGRVMLDDLASSSPALDQERFRGTGEGGATSRAFARSSGSCNSTPRSSLDGVAGFIPQLARRAVKHGVDDNLATLKLLLEERRPRKRR